MTDDDRNAPDHDPTVSAALASHAHPFDPDPAAGPDDLAPVADRLSGAAVVGLGEATHGTREFVRARARLVRLLVADLGVRRIALEARPTAAVRLDEAVAGGRPPNGDPGDPNGDPGDPNGDPGDPNGDPGDPNGDPGDPAAALEGLRWFWRTEGIRSLVRWLRRFNGGRPPADRVRIRGIEVADLQAAFSRVDGYLRAAAPDRHRSVADDLAAFAAGEATPAGADDPVIDDAERLAAGIRERIEGGPAGDGERRALDGDRSVRAAARARYLCRAVERTCGWLRAGGADPGFDPGAYEARDRTMAEGVRSWVPGPGVGGSGGSTAGVGGSGPTGDGCVAVLAHDGHVQRGRFDDGRPWSDRRTMGGVLAGSGVTYRAVGTEFARGRFRAVGADDPADPLTFELGDPPAGSLAAGLATAGQSPLWVDLRAAADDDRLRAWFDRPRRTRTVGSVFDPGADPDRWVAETDLPASFDALVFVRETAPSRPIHESGESVDGSGESVDGSGESE